MDAQVVAALQAVTDARNALRQGDEHMRIGLSEGTNYYRELG